MPVLLEGNANFTEEEEHFILFVTSDNFPWYASMATKTFPCLTHVFMKRTNDRTAGEPWSNHCPAAEIVFRRICADNNITVRTIYRMAANLTFSDPSLHGDPHNDHDEFPHKVMLIYLNDFEAGETWLFDKELKVETKIAPSKDKFVVFEGGNHAQGFCKPQQMRFVFVATFDGDVLPKDQAAA